MIRHVEHLLIVAVALGALTSTACGQEGPPDASAEVFDAGLEHADAGALDAGAGHIDAGCGPPSDAGARADAGGPALADGGASDSGPSTDAGDGDSGSLVEDAGAPDEAVDSYCACVFVACHDDFHATFGEDDLASIEACRVFASELPRTGAPALVGHSLECRQHWCEAQPADCPSALGLNATCTDG